MKLKQLMLALVMILALPQFAAHATDVGETEQDSVFEAWCAQGTRTLERARQQAAGQIAYGNFSGAAQTLLGALRTGVTRPSWSIKPVTWKLMVHARDIGTNLLSAGGNDTRGLKATVNALEALYDLILRSANEIDRPYYRRHCGYCQGQGVAAFELQVLRMSGDLLAVVNSNMTFARAGRVFSFGPSKSYLVGVETATGAALAEISDLLFAEAYACELMELESIQEELAYFNARQSTENERVGMFYDTYERLGDVISQLQAGRGCGHRRY
jgi:hypothetical protein